jgi:tetratricopeptide (TPR) repeat protein
METSLPFGLLAEALRSLGGRDMLQPAGAPSVIDARAAKFFAVLHWLENLAPTPVLLALDDLHWADPDSLALLSFLCRRLASLPVVVIGTVRPWPPDALGVIAELAHGGHALVERLAPLSEGASGALIAFRVGHGVPETLIRRAWEVCGGNPLLLEQVAHSIGRGEDVPELAQVAARRVAEQLLLVRFAGLPATGLRCARAASVLGTRFRPDMACEVAHLDEGEVDVALDALWHSGLVRSGSGSWAEFVHPLFRQALYDDLAPPLRARLHARALAVLTRHGMEAEAAEHVIRADLVGNPEAISVLEKAAETAIRAGAPATAAHHLEAAITLAGSHASPPLLLAQGQALNAAGRPGQAIPVYERLLVQAELPLAIRSQGLRRLGRALMATGAHEQASVRFQEAADLAQLDDPASAVQALLDHARACWSTTGPAVGLPLTIRARELARTADTAVQSRAETALGFMSLLSGDATGLEMAAAAARVLEADPSLTAPVCRALRRGGPSVRHHTCRRREDWSRPGDRVPEPRPHRPLDPAGPDR